MKRLIAIASILLLSVSFTSQVQAEKIKKLDKVVVTATKTPTSLREISSSLTIINQTAIQNSKSNTLGELLRTVPGLDVVESGGLGKTTSVFLRGAKSEHTLVLIDGTEVNDPSSAGHSYNFAHLLCDDVEKIEIIRGPQSTLYGSNSLGGVINIITKKGKPGFQANAGFAVGTYNTFKENLSISGGTDSTTYFANVSRLDSEGFSAASKAYSGNTEKDGYQNTTAAATIELLPIDNASISLRARYSDFESDVDNGSGAGQDDPNHVIDGKHYHLKSGIDCSLLDGKWKPEISIGYAKNDWNDNNDQDVNHPLNYQRSSFQGTSLQLDWQNTVTPNDYHTIIGGFDYEEEKAETTYYSESAGGTYTADFAEKKACIKGFYLQDQIKIADAFYPTVGIRYDKHDKFGSKTTYKIAPAYINDATNTKLKASYATGFKSPSLYQLYSVYGDENLKPEKTTGYELGIEQLILDEKLMLELVYFNNDFEELIDYDFDTLSYLNISKAESKGVELNCAMPLWDNFTANLNYTYTETKDNDKDEELMRRAKNKANLHLLYDYSEQLSVNLFIKYVGKRKNKDFSAYPALTIDKGSYTLVDLIATYAINDQFEVYVKVLNMFDKEYEEVNGFGTAGRAFYAGVKATV